MFTYLKGIVTDVEFNYIALEVNNIGYLIYTANPYSFNVGEEYKVFVYTLIREDEEHLDELRYDVLGKVGKVLFVVCTFREGDTIRLISARPATKAEKARYEHGEDQDE